MDPRPAPQGRAYVVWGSGGDPSQVQTITPGHRHVGGEPACRRGSVRRLPGGVAIHLSGLPGDIGRAARPLFDLAPSGVYQAARVTPGAGALLPHRFNLACAMPRHRHRRFVFCGTVLRVAPTGR